MNKPGVTFNPDTSTLTVALGNKWFMKEISLVEVPAKVIAMLTTSLTERMDVTIYMPGSTWWIELQHVTETDPDGALDIRVGVHGPGGEGTAWAHGSSAGLLASLEAVKGD